MSELVESCLEALKKGGFIIVVDDENRENEGDLIIAAEKATSSALAFMIRHTTGIICLSMEGKRLDELLLPQMVAANTDRRTTAFTVSVDSLQGTTTGVSASDRTKTILDLIDPQTRPEDLSRPGHIFPLRYKEGGVLSRSGHTEAAVDLARLAGLYPAGVIGELINDDGSMMRMPELLQFAGQHQIQLISVSEIVRYRQRKEILVSKISQAFLPTAHGNFIAYVYQSLIDGIEHVAIVKGDVHGQPNILVRVHSECFTGDVLQSRRCDCGEQLDSAMNKINREGKGVVVYLKGHEGRGIGLAHKLQAYNLQDQGWDTVEANEELGLPIDSRDYRIGAQILLDLGLTSIRLMTNNPNKHVALEELGLSVVERVPLISESTEDNFNYLYTKQVKMGHLLGLKDPLTTL